MSGVDRASPLIEARVSALRQLALQAPALVIAHALGFHQGTTTRQRGHAGGNWNRYTGERTPAKPTAT